MVVIAIPLPVRPQGLGTSGLHRIPGLYSTVKDKPGPNGPMREEPLVPGAEHVAVERPDYETTTTGAGRPPL